MTTVPNFKGPATAKSLLELRDWLCAGVPWTAFGAVAPLFENPDLGAEKSLADVLLCILERLAIDNANLRVQINPMAKYQGATS